MLGFLFKNSSETMESFVAFHLLVLTSMYAIIPCACLTCDDSRERKLGICGQLSNDIERALLSDEGNRFRIRRHFFRSPTASPVLVKVIYNITYGEDLITAVSNETLDHCSSQVLSSTINFEPQLVTMGWTSSGVYTMFHPTVLSVMQAQTPFSFLRIIQLTLTNQRSPEADTFLWDGSYDLPTLHINLPINTMTCIPSQDLFDSVLMDLNKNGKIDNKDCVLSASA